MKNTEGLGWRVRWSGWDYSSSENTAARVASAKDPCILAQIDISAVRAMRGCGTAASGGIVGHRGVVLSTVGRCYVCVGQPVSTPRWVHLGTSSRRSDRIPAFVGMVSTRLAWSRPTTICCESRWLLHSQRVAVCEQESTGLLSPFQSRERLPRDECLRYAAKLVIYE